MEKQLLIMELKRLVHDLVSDDVDLLVGDHRNGRLSQDEIEGALWEYGGVPTMPPDMAFEHVQIIPLAGDEAVAIDFELWFEERRSDLTIACMAQYLDGHGYHLELADIHTA